MVHAYVDEDFDEDQYDGSFEFVNEFLHNGTLSPFFDRADYWERSSGLHNAKTPRRCVTRRFRTNLDCVDGIILNLALMFHDIARRKDVDEEALVNAFGNELIVVVKSLRRAESFGLDMDGDLVIHVGRRAFEDCLDQTFDYFEDETTMKAQCDAWRARSGKHSADVPPAVEIVE